MFALLTLRFFLLLASLVVSVVVVLVGLVVAVVFVVVLLVVIVRGRCSSSTISSRISQTQTSVRYSSVRF